MSPLPIVTTVAPSSLRLVAARVEQRLVPMFNDELARWAELDPALIEPLTSMRDLALSSAKRIRPAFCYWGHVGAGGDPDDDLVIDAGGALELLQAFALVHDDIMDGSATRRGRRTAHLEFADEHRSNSWRGEGRRFGEGVAILIGDLAHVYADRLMMRVPDEARAVWDELRIELNIGQYLDLVGTAKGDTDLSSARRVARYKSGKYTVERPLHLGAAIAGDRGEFREVYSNYGDPLGEAFQLRDDLLGAFGDTSQTGKPVGDDLREGKPTTLLAEATQRANPAQSVVLKGVGTADLSTREICDLQQVLVDTGARAAIEARVDILAAQAVAVLESVDLAENAGQSLIELAWYVAHRDV